MGAVVDVVVDGVRAVPHRAADLDAPRSAATYRVVGDGLSAGQQVQRTQPAIEAMPRCSLHLALRAVPRCWTGDDLRRTLRASSAHAKPHGGWVWSIRRQRAGASALRMTLEHEVCAHVSTERVCEHCFRHQYVLDVWFTHVTGRSNRYHASGSYTVFSDWFCHKVEFDRQDFGYDQDCR